MATERRSTIPLTVASSSEESALRVVPLDSACGDSENRAGHAERRFADRSIEWQSRWHGGRRGRYRGRDIVIAVTGSAGRHLVPTRTIALVGVAGMIVGPLVGGLGARLFMRIAGAVAPATAQGAGTEAGFTIGEITLAGTIGLVVFAGIPAGIFGAALTVIFLPWLGWAGAWRGVALGVALFAVASAVSDVLNPDNFDFLLIRNGWLVVTMILALFVAFGVGMDVAVRVLDRRSPPVERAGSGWRIAYAAVTALGIVLAGLLVPVALFTENFCGCEPPLVASSFVVVAATGTAVSWVADMRAGRGSLHRVARTLGYGGLAGAVVFGLARAVTDAADIVSR